MFKAVVTDLDGTLLNEKHVVSEYTKKVIKKLLEKGVKFYIATGRLHASTKEIMESIGIEIPLITTNGTRILDENGKEIYNSILDSSLVETIADFDYLKYGKDIFINGYNRDKWLVTDKRAEIYYRETRPDKPYFPKTISKEEFRKQEFNKMHFVGNHEGLLEISKNLGEKIGEKAHLVFVGKHCLEIFSKETNKFKAAKLLLERDGIDVSEAIGFGDSSNDYEMLTQLGKGYIMGNGIYLLKEKAPHLEIIDTNVNDGEAKKLVEIFDLEV